MYLSIAIENQNQKQKIKKNDEEITGFIIVGLNEDIVLCIYM